MNYLKTFRKIRKYGRILNAVVNANADTNAKRKKKSRTAKALKKLNKQTPFYSLFASVQVQKERNAGYLMLGNDFISQALPEELKEETDEWTVNGNIAVKIKRNPN